MRNATTRYASALAFALLLLPALAGAGWFDRGKPQKQRPVPAPAHRDRVPSLEFAAGVVTVDGFGHYRVGHCSLVFPPDDESPRRGRRLQLGEHVVISGHPQPDGTLLVHRILKAPPVPHLQNATALNAAPVGELPPGTPQ